jgi:iron only hydrogenase large subunit-like protein
MTMRPSPLVSTDYLEPAAECIKPAQPSSTSSSEGPVTVSLTDCLACSGCITSADAILVNRHAWTLLDEAVEVHARPVVFTVSPQSRVALAHELGLSVADADRRLVAFLRSVPNCLAVLDSNVGRSLSLWATAQDFVEHCGRQRGHPQQQQEPQQGDLPRLVSVCPGWICFVEKTKPELIPQVSAARSPQQIMGALVRLQFPPTTFHVAIMPCHDKKLEASRHLDFSFLDNGTVPDVDLVVTTQELLQRMRRSTLMAGHNADNEHLNLGASTDDDDDDENGHGHDDESGLPFGPSDEGSGAGGYLEFTLAYAMRQLYPDICNWTVEEYGKRADSVDFVEYTVRDPDRGGVLLRMARVWGMHNIQNWLRHKSPHALQSPQSVQSCQLPSSSSSSVYDFVEVMACPGACLNGGGQFAVDMSPIAASRESKVDRLKAVQSLYDGLPKRPFELTLQTALSHPCRQLLERHGLLWTTYRAVPLDVRRPFQLKW